MGSPATGLDFHIVDVFAEKKYAGNQLAVVRNAGGLSTSTMQQIAREMHFSETTFVISDEPRKAAYDVRIFTPATELPFAGHPVLGTAQVIRDEIIRKRINGLKLNLKIGQISVRFEDKPGRMNMVWMRQNEPDFGEVLDRASVSKVLNLEEQDIDSRFPIQDVTTGLATLIVPLKSMAALNRARVSTALYFELIEKIRAKAILVFSPETHEKDNDLSVRVFTDFAGVPEDPATGSSNGCLAGYLANYQYFGKNQLEVSVEQGYNIKRPSKLYLKAATRKNRIEVDVGGKVVPIAKGKLL
jgi:trans-2,3-dihydro-3-hydroxyanthranilate isomerase